MTQHAGYGVLYEVVVSLDPDIRDAYLDWLRPHVREILAFDGFLGADIFVDSDDPLLVTSAYRLRDAEAMQAYLDGPAARMRAEGLARFGGKMSAKRRVLRRLPL